MDKETLAFVHYCTSLLTMISNTEIAHIENVQITSHSMSFVGHHKDYYIFGSEWLNRDDYKHSTLVTGVTCEFYVSRPHADC